jgi:hypothetical protein
MHNKPDFEALYEKSRVNAIEVLAMMNELYADLAAIKEAFEAALDAFKNTIQKAAEI